MRIIGSRTIKYIFPYFCCVWDEKVFVAMGSNMKTEQ